VHAADARLSGQHGGGARVVAGEHGDVDAELAHPADGFRSFRAQLVAHGDRAEQPGVPFDQHHGGTLVLEPFDDGGERARGDPAGLAQA
jgi:hypothetical protein